MQMKYSVGIDEAGRGPLAGPVAVGVVKIPKDFDWTRIPGVGDSKQVSPKKRAEIFKRAQELRRMEELDFIVILMSASHIDTYGIARSIAIAIERAIKKLQLNPQYCFIKLDGSLRAPIAFSQETIIKGDSKECVIGLASIVAKETRDIYMMKMAKKYPLYELDVHKGYGTKRHRQLIFKNGLSEIHRTSYCQNRSVWGKV
jgi:ribonuclease HII